jgi:tRNA threonylcarbamoyladenosine biosynthesis protein TsaE
MITVELVSPAATGRLGAAIASLVRAGDVVLLSGDLGAGKTTLVAGLAAGLGSTTPATSPTFALCHFYPTEPVLAHVDCWRLDKLAEIVDLGLDEVLEDGGVVVIEWGERAAPLLGEDALVVELAPGASGSESERLAQLRANSPSWGQREEALLVAARAAELPVAFRAGDLAAGRAGDGPAPRGERANGASR